MKVASSLIVNPGSEQIRATAERDGMIAAFEDIGATIMANACGPCIGQWKRHTDDPERKNSIVTSFNRNFAKRADGNPNTFAYAVDQRIGGVHRAPVDRPVVLIVDDRADLQQVENLLLPRR